MHDDLKKLLELQEKDRRVTEIQDELSALEPELAELDGIIVGLEEELVAARNRVVEAAGRREALESKIESYRVMQERRRQKLEWVRGAREASTLMAEIDLARTVLAKEESEWIRSADEVQSTESHATEVEARVTEVREGQAGRREEIRNVQDDCKARLEEALRERESAAKHVSRSLLGRYERIRKGRAPFAVYPLHTGACGHCFTTVPLHLQQQMQQSQSISACEACGVMIYLPVE